MTSALRIISPNTKPTFEANKWLEVRFLIDIDEMEALIQTLTPFDIYLANGLSFINQGMVTHKQFIDCYEQYVNAIKGGDLPKDKDYRALFSSSWTVAVDHLYAIPIGNNQQLIRIEKPVLQLQAHCMRYSSADNTFRSMVYGRDSITWGLQCSYPQIFQNHLTNRIDKVTEGLDFPNTSLFRKLQHWVRLNTIPTPFSVGEDAHTQRINSPVRLGKKCLSWINRHPQLVASHIKIIT